MRCIRLGMCVAIVREMATTRSRSSVGYRCTEVPTACDALSVVAVTPASRRGADSPAGKEAPSPVETTLVDLGSIRSRRTSYHGRPGALDPPRQHRARRQRQRLCLPRRGPFHSASERVT